MNIRYLIARQLFESLGGAGAAISTATIMITGALFLGDGTAAAISLPALSDLESQTYVTSPEAYLSSGLTDAPSLEGALLGAESGEDNSIFDIEIDAPETTAPGPEDTQEDLLTEADGYPMMSSARGFESSGSGRGWVGPVVVAGVAAGILAVESNRHIDHGFRFGGPGNPKNHDTPPPPPTPSLGPNETPGDTTPADVPEPGTLALFAAGIAIATAFRRRLTSAGVLP